MKGNLKGKMKPPIVQKNPPHSMYDDVIYRWPLTLLVKSIMQNHARVKHKVFQITLLLHYLKLGHLRPIQFQNYLQIHSRHRGQNSKYTSGQEIWRNSSSFLGHQHCHRHGTNSLPARQLKSTCHYVIFVVFFNFSKIVVGSDDFN